MSYSLQIESEMLSEMREIFVRLPEGYETSEKKYPVLYVLDAGGSLFWQGKRKKAIEVFQFMTEESPNSPDAFEDLGLAYEEENQLEKSKKAYESALMEAKENCDRRLPRFEEYLTNIEKKMKDRERYDLDQEKKLYLNSRILEIYSAA